jgi:hypothetical protein
MDDTFMSPGSEDGFGEDVDMGFGESGVGEAALDEVENEAALEADEFGRLFRLLKRRALPLLRRIAPRAAQAVLGRLPGSLGEDEDEDEDLDLEAFGAPTTAMLLADDDESLEEQDEDDIVPGLSVEDEALAEALAAAAMTAGSEEEAAGLVGGVTIQILGPTPIRIRRMTPLMVSRATRLVKVLRRSKRTRPLVPLVSTITKKTVKRLTRRAASGKSITPRIVATTMAKQTARTLASPKRVACGLVRNRIKRKRLNRKVVARVER